MKEDSEERETFPEQISATESPEDVLRVVADEIRRPINSIEAIAVLLSDVDFTEHDRELLRSIPKMTRRMKALLDVVEVYVQERRKLKREDRNEG